MKKVVEETGLTADTIRAWEDRYGLPEPQRSGGGHRLYSLHDIEVVKWILRRKNEGIRPGQAVQMYQDLVHQGQDPLIPGVKSQSGDASQVRLAMFRQRWLDACLNFDEVGANTAVAQAQTEFIPIKVLRYLLIQGMQEVGQGWAEGRVSVAQEHFATQVVTHKLEQLRAALPQSTSKRTVLVTCAHGERHDLPALLLAYLLQQAGWQTLYLGSDLPEIEIAALLAKTRIDAAVLAGTTLATAPALQGLIRRLRSLGIPVGFGGYIYQKNQPLRNLMPGVYLGEDIERVVLQVPRLLLETQPSTSVAPAPMEGFLAHFREHKSQIIIAHQHALGSDAGENSRLHDLCISFIDSVEAAAELGAFDLLSHELTWLDNYLRDNQYLDYSSRDFLTTFGQATVAAIGDNAHPMISWLS